jgi:hypothetical protein
MNTAEAGLCNAQISSPPLGRRRLGFVLPEFTRWSWVSETARSTWEPRIERIKQAWLSLEWLSVANDVRDCALIWLPPDTLSTFTPQWEFASLSAIQLQIDNAHFGGNVAQSDASPTGLICIAVGDLTKLTQLREAWIASDHDTIGALLGYPACCRAFFRDVWADKRCIDTTWQMAENTTPAHAPDRIRIELPDTTAPVANILWRWLGVRAVPHLPCRFNCDASISLGTRFLEIARANGYAEEADWIAEILSWPVEWSALHGIAEIKTPLLKISTRTDATWGKSTVKWVGTSYPEEGASGLNFPYRMPKKPKLTSSRPYRRGFAHGTHAAADQPWYHADNGFASVDAMDGLHRPIVEKARRALRNEGGNVLDLGCGNGVLVGKICEGRSDLIPFGVDANPAAIDHARLLSPDHSGNFMQADLFDIPAWEFGRRYALALLMAGRLMEVPRDRALELLEQLRSSCSRVLVYTYPDWGDTPLASIAKQLGLELNQTDGAVSFLSQPRADDGVR